MNVPQVVRKIKKFRPELPKDFRTIKIPLQREGAGIFRVVYRVKGLPLVVKFPLEGTPYRSGKLHSVAEVRKIQKMKKIRALREHVPTVYYHDKKSGVLVMSWHKEFSTDQDAFTALGRLTTKALMRWVGVNVSDIHDDNVRQGKNRRKIIFIDLGY